MRLGRDVLDRKEGRGSATPAGRAGIPHCQSALRTRTRCSADSGAVVWL